MLHIIVVVFLTRSGGELNIALVDYVYIEDVDSSSTPEAIRSLGTDFPKAGDRTLSRKDLGQVLGRMSSVILGGSGAVNQDSVLVVQRHESGCSRR